MERQVVCISWGTKYGAAYVNRLYAMVARNLTPPFSFTCFTDDAKGFNPAILLMNLVVRRRPGVWPQVVTDLSVRYDVEGGGGKPDEWLWSRVRPWLAEEFGRPLPERFPSLRPPA